MKVKIKLSCFFLIVVFIVTGCSKIDIKEKKIISVGVRTDIINFSNYNQNTNKYYGLEIDISSEIAERLGYTDIVYVPVQAEERSEKLEKEQVDCVIACYSVTQDRKEKVDFSSPYYIDCIAALVQKSSLITGIEDLDGSSIGVLAGTNVEEMVKEWFLTQKERLDINFVEYESYKEMEYALEIGDVDAICSDGCILQQYLTEYRSLYFFEGLNQEYCVTTKKGSLLSVSMDEIVKEMEQDGTLKELIEKWN